MNLERLELLIGGANLKKIKNTKVLVLGLGGVGGYAIESLARCGIINIVGVDYDKIDDSNINRQIICTNSNIGKYKVDAFEERLKDINPDIEFTKIKKKIIPANMDIIINLQPDYIIDACDYIETKKELIRICVKNNIKLISSMGTGNKLDPSKLKIMDIRKTNYDPIAKIIRKMVKDEKINKKIMVVCSDEEKVINNIKDIPSNSFVPPVAGLLCTSYVINDIIK